MNSCVLFLHFFRVVCLLTVNSGCGCQAVALWLFTATIKYFGVRSSWLLTSSLNRNLMWESSGSGDIYNIFWSISIHIYIGARYIWTRTWFYVHCNKHFIYILIADSNILYVTFTVIELSDIAYWDITYYESRKGELGNKNHIVAV